MGLFYKALQRAEASADREPEAAEPGAATRLRPEPVRAAAAGVDEQEAAPRRLASWAEAERRDLAGYALPPAPEAAAEADAEAVPDDGATQTVGWDLASLGPAANPEGLAKEQYRMLRTRLLQAMRTNGLRSLLITSPGPGEGKTLVAANLALELSALGEKRVLLIDADLRRAGLSASLRPTPELGLGTFLQGEASPDEAVRVIHSWLSVLPTAIAASEAPELLASTRMRELLTGWARERFDLILLDGAPVAPVADSHILARMVDASLLVVRAQQTLTEEIQRASAVLQPGLLGSVLNGARMRRRGRYGHYGYGYGSPQGVEAPAKP